MGPLKIVQEYSGPEGGNLDLEQVIFATPRAPKLVPVVHSKPAKTNFFTVNVRERLPRKYVVSTQRRRSTNTEETIEQHRIHKGTWSMIQTMMMIIYRETDDQKKVREVQIS